MIDWRGGCDNASPSARTFVDVGGVDPSRPGRIRLKAASRRSLPTSGSEKVKRFPISRAVR
jgi:hypothetical protein